MFENIEKAKTTIIGVVVAQSLLLLAILMFALAWAIGVLLVFFIMDVALIIWLLATHQKEQSNRVLSITRILGKDAKDALLLGGIGLVTYDENYVVTWANELFDERNISLIGERINSLDPKINQLITSESEHLILTINEHTYQVSKKENSSLLFFEDITKQYQLEQIYNNEKVVVGYVQLDNYEESTQYEEEQKIAFIEAKLRQPVIDWAKSNGIFVKRVKSDRFLLVLNEQIFKRLIANRFDILDYIRNTGTELDVTITLSMAFAKGIADFNLLDEMANNALELAQSRGGDQVAIKQYNKETTYFGGSSQAQEKRSKVKVRVMAQSIKELIMQAEQIIIVGHKEMDFDCMGSALGLSRIVTTLHKPVYIVSKSGGIEAKLNKAFLNHQQHLTARHKFVSEVEAADILTDQTLVIMVDHHSKSQSNGQALIDVAKKVIIIDHHRRRGEFDFDPMLAYIESAASSVSELVSELIPYQLEKVDISDIEATFMLTGILIDTSRFRIRTGSRTFDAASYLRNLGADTVLADEYLKDNFKDFETKANILNSALYLEHGVVVAPFSENNKNISRTIMSLAAEELLTVKEVEAAFVIAKIETNQVAISARSKGKVNVQIIMEAMNGGGHFGAAALQRENTTVEELALELYGVLDKHFNQEEPS